MPGLPVKTPSILIVEDNGIIALMLQEFLKKYGYRILVPLASGEDAIQYLKNFSMPDLILMDITLDGMIDGVETTRKIRETSDVPVIFISAHPEEETLIRAGKITGFGYITKPFNLSDVLSDIDRMLHSSKGFTGREPLTNVLAC